MQNIIKILTISMLCLTTNMTFAAMEQPKLPQQLSVTTQNDLKKLQTLWQSYQSSVEAMNKALPNIKQEKDSNKRDAAISLYNQKLEQTKNALNQLILAQSTANKLRQQIIEHATKYQGVYKLAALENPNANQMNVFQRLNDQTSSLYQQMLSTAQTISN